MPLTRPCLALIFVSFAASALAGQAVPVKPPVEDPPAATTNDEGPRGIIPFVKGPNFSFGTTSQHDSTNGWSSLITPDIAWRFSRHYSADVTTPIYDYINVVDTSGTALRPIYTNDTKRLVAGDTMLNAHVQFDPRFLSYELIGSLGLPTGNKDYGLGAGRPTYNFNTHVEKGFDWFTPDLEIGIGDSSSLIGPEMIRKSYITVGELAHFQLGASFDLPFHTQFESEAYEELPVGRQTTYSTTGKGKKKVTTATTTGAAEDNGFSNQLTIPLNGHVNLSGFYNRSLRNKIDTVGFTFTFLLRAPPPLEK